MLMNIIMKTGDDSSSLGLASGSGCEVFTPFMPRQALRENERSRITKYRKKIWSKFTSAVVEYEFLKPGDKIAVAISGGEQRGTE